MFDYFLYRWIFARRFEKVDTGYVYRRRSDLPGIEVSADERRETLREFRRRYLRSWLQLLLGWFTVVTVFVIIGLTLNFGESAMTFAAYGLVILLFILVLKQHRELFALPEKLFADRPRVPPEFEPAGWFTRYQRLSRQRSWPVHAALLALYGGFGWLLAPRSMEADPFHWFLFACAAAGLVVLIYGAIVKLRN